MCFNSQQARCLSFDKKRKVEAQSSMFGDQNQISTSIMHKEFQNIFFAYV